MGSPEPAWVEFESLARSDLHVDCVYHGGKAGGRGDDPLHPLLGVGNAGGFRVSGAVMKQAVRLGVLYTSGVDPDWPDTLDIATGTFVYHGDQKTPGKDLHDTARKGNLFLRDIFTLAAGGSAGRAKVPPLFVFEKAGAGTDVIFRGLVVPGSPSVRTDEQLVAVWRSRGGTRFQNYRATFTVLDTTSISRAWLEDLKADRDRLANAPDSWRRWVESGAFLALGANRALEHRTKEEQLPTDANDVAMLSAITEYFSRHGHALFEHCAAKLWQMMAPAAEIAEVTRPSADGGRDAIGTYSLGPVEDRIKLSFCLEAKCYAATNSVGVKETARLISRLKHREFGVFVTTSYIGRQAYEELRADRHPVVVICGADIVRLLKARDISTAAAVTTWLASEFPGKARPDFVLRDGLELEIGAPDPASATRGHPGSAG